MSFGEEINYTIVVYFNILLPGVGVKFGKEC